MSSDPKDVVIVGAARTANGKLKGAFATLSAIDLGAAAISGALEKGGVAPEKVDAVIMGNVLQAGLGQCPARQAAIAAGLPWSVYSNTVNKVCLSGLVAIIDAARMLRLGDARVVVAGGMESMTNAPHVLPGSRFGWGFGNATLVDTMANDGLSDAWSHEAMGLDTEKRLADYPVSREAMDAVSARSHELAAKAQAEGVFDDEIVPVVVKNRKGDVTVTADEGVRPETTVESLAGLRPAFSKDGVLTAGNSSTINDGGAAVVLTTREVAEAEGWTVLAAVRSAGQVAGPSPALAPQPANAIKKALELEGWTVDDIDLFEINEAFAAVGCWSVEDLGAPMDKVNVHGGAIALGHPIGQSGARLVVHLAHELSKRGGGKGAVALCGGTGQGDALLLEA